MPLSCTPVDKERLGVSGAKHDNLGGAVPYPAGARRRRVVGIGESVVDHEGAFAEWHGCARIDAQLHKYGGQVSRLTEPG